jgi:uncharacterized tellurite resistance protein B-like protein
MTGPFSHDSFDDRRLGLEQEYFRSKDAELVTKLKSVFHAKMEKDEITKASGITDPAVLDRMVAVQLRGEMLVAFKLYPLVEIAWADGKLDPSEADAVIDAAIKSGVPKDSESLKRLKEWLERGPNDNARAVWRMYAAQLRKTLSKEELETFRTDLLRYAKTVAQASGGVLGMFFQVSLSEQRVIDIVEQSLRHS